MTACTAEHSQLERFTDADREAEADDSPDALDRIMGKLDLKKKPEPEPEKRKHE